jgi:hypothetical protein
MKPFGIDTISEIERLIIARRSLNNLLTSYADEADVFTEIIQNAYDSIKLADAEGLYSDISPELTIVIGRRSTGHDYLYVKDNGLGMSKQVANSLTIPGFSHGKKRGKTIGYKGVGASYIFAVSQCASISTISTEGERTEYTVRGSYNWIKNDEDPEPQTESKCFVPNYLATFLPTSRGTGVYFQFHEGMKPSTLNNMVITSEGPEKEIRNWMAFLSVKTPLGTVNESLISNLSIKVHLDRGENQYNQIWQHGSLDFDRRIIGYPFPQKVFRVGEEKTKIDETPDYLRQRHERKHQAIFHRWTADEIINETELDDKEVEVLRQYLIWAEAYFCYSVDVLKEINTRLGGRSRMLRHGIRIASDGAPQGRMIDLSLTSSQGLDRQTHIVLAFENLELDTGRKISADESIASAITKLGNKMVTILKEYRWAMKKKDRPDFSSDLASWRNDVESRSQNSLIIELYKALSLRPVFHVDPSNESEVIALWVSLISHGLLKGYQLEAISGFATYDSLVDINFSEDSFKDANDFLSIKNSISVIEGPGRVLEFKYNFNDLLLDFVEKKKKASEIDLLVCWNIPDLNISRGRLEPTYGKWKDYRTIYGGSYNWYDDNDSTTIPIIALRNLICEILSTSELENNLTGLGTVFLKKLESDDTDYLI